MDDITLNLLVLAILALLGGLVFFLVRRRQAQNEQELIQLAAEKGWKYESIREPLAWGLKLTSPRWTLEALSRSSGQEAGPGSSDVSMLTTWHADASGSTFLIGARTSQANLGGLGEMLTGQVLQLALGADAAGLTEIRAGSTAFQARYMLWAQNPNEVRLTPALETALLSWKGSGPLVKRTSEGLSIELRGVRLRKPAEIRSLAELGELLL
jgi:LPXTG-motif cell wall-anchored protein